MIRRLKKRFVTTTMLSLLAVLLVVLATVNGLFIHNSLEMSDSLLVYLAANDGGFHPQDAPDAPPDAPGSAAEDEAQSDDAVPAKPGGKKAAIGAPEKPAGESAEAPDNSAQRRLRLMQGFRMDQETAFRTRCFSVTFDADGSVDDVRTDRIAAVTEEDALAFADQVLESGKTRGFIDIYRYYVEVREGETFVGFLDCDETLFSFRMLLMLSGGILLFCLIAMWLLLWIFSGRAISPVVESLEKQKRFIADAGHELKTPITIINADAAVLSMTGGANEWVDSIRNQTRRLSGLVGELLTLSRMEADTPMTLSDFSLSEAAEDTVGAFGTLITSRCRSLEIDIQPDISCHGDEQSLRRLISILMDNAAKYTPEGGLVRFSLKKSGHNIVIETLNTCAPFEKKHLNHLFDRFYRVDAARTQSSGGYGIGLSIAREIVQRHHGRIRAACPTPNTITFTATLPAG